MDKSINKKAYLRSDDTDRCPFGLPITDGCRNAGSGIDRLCPLDDIEDDTVKEAKGKLNRKVFFYSHEGKRCKYAENLLKDKEMVNCNWGDTAEGMPTPTLEGSPFYPKIQSGEFVGLYVSPVSFFVTLDTLYRNYPFGMYSYYGSLTNFVFMNQGLIVKLADLLDKDGQYEEVNKIDNILDKVAQGEEPSLQEANEFVDLCRSEFDRRRVTPVQEQNFKISPRSSH